MAVPAWLHTLRSLRPTHVVSALPRGSPLLLLNPRDLRRADGAPLVRTVAPALFAVPAVLRAARDAGAVLGLVKPGAFQGEGPSAAQFAGAVVRAADELGFSAPLFIASAPLPVPADAASGERLRGEIQRYLDAGFTEIALGCSSELAEGSASALHAALAAVREREVSLVLWAARAEHAATLLDELRQVGVTVDLVSLGSAEGSDALDGVALELPSAGGRPGLRGLDLGPSVEKIAARILGELQRPERARELESVDEGIQLKLEAMVYAELFSMLREDPMRGASARVMRALAERPGY